MNPIKNGKITGPFDEVRPWALNRKMARGENLTDSEKSKLHPHAALDIVAKGDNHIYAPCNCIGFAWWSKRDSDGKKHNRAWPKTPEINGIPFAWRNYFYDTYGGVIVLKELDVNNKIVATHLICHSYQNQLFNMEPFSNAVIKTVEEKAEDPYAISAIYTTEIRFREGDLIGHVGNAGYSTGKHIHWEIHPGRSWAKHAERINPLQYM